MRNRRITATVPVTIRAAEQGGDGKRRFTLSAYTGGPMKLGWWQHPVVVDCATLNVEQQRIPCLLDHCPSGSNIVGQVEEVTADATTITAAGIFTPTDADGDAAAMVLAKADAGFQWQVSIGGEPAEVDEIKAGAKVVVNGREFTGPLFVARGVVLREISFVVLGADRNTSALVASHGGVSMQTFEQWLAAQGFADATLTAEQSAGMRTLYAAAVKAAEGEEEEEEAEGDMPPKKKEEEVEAEADEEEDPKPAKKEPVDAKAKNSALKAAQAELKRVKAVTLVCSKADNPKLVVAGHVKPALEHALEAGWSAQKTELEILKASRPEAPNVVIKNGRPSMQALEGAMLLRCGGRLDHKSYGDVNAVGMIPAWLRAGINDATRNQLMEHAHRLAKLSAVDICREALRANGRDVPHDRDEMIQAAFSSGSLTNSMTTSVNAILLSTYLESPDTTQGWVREGEIPNYLTAERVRVLKGDSLEELPEDGEADDATIADTAESYKIKRFAKKFSLDEIAVINDNLGAIKTKPTEFGLAAARLRPDLVYATILANPTLAATTRALFNSTDANLLTGSALSESTLGTALARMSVIKENGVNIDVTPTHLIIPPYLRETARRCIGSPVVVGNTTANALMGSLNTLTDWQLDLVAEKRLENGVTHPSTKTAYAGSTVYWYLASSQAPALEVGYLRGQRVPRVRSGQLDRGKFGMWWDVSLSIGVCPLDWKGIQKMT